MRERGYQLGHLTLEWGRIGILRERGRGYQLGHLTLKWRRVDVLFPAQDMGGVVVSLPFLPPQGAGYVSPGGGHPTGGAGHAAPEKSGRSQTQAGGGGERAKTEAWRR